MIKIVAFHRKTKMPCLGGCGLFVRRTCMQNEKHDMRGWELHQKSVAELVAHLAAFSLVENPKQVHLQSIGTASQRKTLFSSGIPIHA